MLGEAIPRMFHRRLLLIGGVTLGVYGVLGGRAAWMTAVEGEASRERAEAKLVSRVWTPTVRGRILDRVGRVVAEDRAAYDVGVMFPVIAGEWARDRATERARRQHRADWPGWTAAEREAAVGRYLPAYEAHEAAGWSLLARTLGATREDIDARRAEVVARVQQRQDAVARQRRERELARAAERGEPLSVKETADIERRSNEPIAERGRSHVLVAGLRDATGLELDRLASETVELVVWRGEDGAEAVTERVELIPGLRVTHSGERVYPLETMTVELDTTTLPGPLRGGVRRVEVSGVATQIVGWMREGVRTEDELARAGRLERDEEFRGRVEGESGVDRGFYDSSVLEQVGASGVESSMEHELRGLRGERIRRLNTGEVRVVPAVPGRDVTLTLDMELQSRVQAVMSPEVGLAVVQPWNKSPEFVAGADGVRKPNPAYRAEGTPLHGAAVVLDVDSGEILAMVSTPSFVRAELGGENSRVFSEAAGLPYLNRAMGRPYPPGSIAKALMLCGAGERGKYTPGERIDCTGHLYPNQPNALRCWIYKRGQVFGPPMTHNEQLGQGLDAAEALMVSCNIFFYTLGQRLGASGVAEVYREFGVGSRWDLGIGPEYGGAVGTSKMGVQDGIMMAIGQGPVSWTPLHAADSYATIGRLGTKIRPRAIRDSRLPEITRLPFDQESASEALSGLGMAVNAELGTGHHIVVNDQRVKVFDHDPSKVWIWGKTGTAAGLEYIDPDGSGPEDRERVEGDHSWYVILVGRAEERRPRYAVAVLMEYAGSGGKVSGPICNQIVHALIAEGYL
jgi:penicillin-binding protein 2